MRPLEGTTVLDLTRLLPGNYCTWLLAALGADVLKVEDTGAGDYMRSFGAQVEGQGATHHLVNRAKRSISIDLKDERGRAVLLDLLDGADVLVESFRPGVLGRLGFGPEVLHERRPSLVVASLSGYGGDGPLAAAPGHDLNYLALSGLLDRLGHADARPPSPPIPFADLVGGGLVPALAITAALHEVRRTGVGVTIDASLAEGIALLPNLVVGDLLAGAEAPPRGHTEFGGGLACYDVYELADGHVTVGAVEPQFWKAVCEELGEPDLVARQHDDDQDHVRERLRAHFGAMSKAEAEARFHHLDACVLVVSTYEEVLHGPVAAARDFVRDEEGVPFPVLAPPFLFDGERPPGGGGAPRQGEHTREVLAALGRDATEVEALLDAGVVRST